MKGLILTILAIAAVFGLIWWATGDVFYPSLIFITIIIIKALLNFVHNKEKAQGY
jgi:hypothetical protein